MITVYIIAGRHPITKPGDKVKKETGYHWTTEYRYESSLVLNYARCAYPLHVENVPKIGEFIELSHKLTSRIVEKIKPTCLHQNPDIIESLEEECGVAVCVDAVVYRADDEGITKTYLIVDFAQKLS